MSSELQNLTRTVFKQTFGHDAAHLIQAPGRVNLIGEHTDYNDGFVFPCAINFQTVVAAEKREDKIVKVVALDFGNEIDEFNLDDDIVSVNDKSWANYIRGVLKYLRKRGYQFGGANIAVSGNVPQGAGLSSSASLEVAIGQTFQVLYNLDISQQEIALNGQEAENKFVGCNCGIMDQLISACGMSNHALLIDCRSLETTAVALPESLSIVIVHSNMKRELVGSEYNTRRESCEAAASFFEVKALRDVKLSTFNQRVDEMPALHAKRARHVITENARTLAMEKAFAAKNMKMISQLMADSHASMRDDFEITIPEIDKLVEIIDGYIGHRGGARMTGGGFGGCVVALIPNEEVKNVVSVVDTEYKKATGITPTVFICKASEGAGEIKP